MAFASVRIQLCGRLAVEGGGARLEGRLPGRQGRLLLAYLAANWDRAVTRDELCFAIWGDDLPPDADNGLSALISKVRRVVGPARVDGRSELRFVADEETFVDMHAAIEALHRAEAHVAGGRWQDGWQPGHTAFQVARRDFLLGHDAPWVDEWRHRMSEVATRALECHVRCYLGTGVSDALAGERAAGLLIERAPFRETGYALLMEALARQGNPAEALRVYDRLRCLLAEELGVAPGPEVTHLRDRLRGAPSDA